ncbi:hypothetical protein ACS0TY_033671 [Phlomoides rotata]
MTNVIQYPSFHFMKLQRPDQMASTCIKTQETKPALVVNLTEDEVSTRRAWRVWVCLTEMDKVKYSFKIYQNYENSLIGTESTRRKTCNIMHNGRWHERVCNFCATQKKPLFGNNFPVKRDRPGKELWKKKGTNFQGNKQSPQNM